MGKGFCGGLPEMGAVGEATIVAVAPCPEIEKGQGRVITGRFIHRAANVVDLLISGEEEPIGTTDNHPFWSEDRQEYVAAGELRVGENLRTVNGSRTYVQSIRPRGPPEDVYNLEVEGAHTYHVGTTGVLVHNSCYDDVSDLRVTNKVGAGAARPPRHHIFPLENRSWFEKRGFDIDKVTVELDQGTHSALHTMGWNRNIMNALMQAELRLGRALTAREIWKIGYRQMRLTDIADLVIHRFVD